MITEEIKLKLILNLDKMSSHASLICSCASNELYFINLMPRKKKKKFKKRLWKKVQKEIQEMIYENLMEDNKIIKEKTK